MKSKLCAVASRWWVWPVAVALGFVLLQGVGGHQITYGSDSVLYAQISLRLYGTPAQQANVEANRAACVDNADNVGKWAAADPMHNNPAPAMRKDCAKLGVGPPNAQQRRYAAIFNGRVGYPLLAGVPIKIFGIAEGLWLTSVLVTAVGGFLVAVLLFEVGLGLTAMLAGELLFLLSPFGTWGVWPLPEGTLNTAVLATLVGALWLMRRRLLRGGLHGIAGLTAVTATKYSSAVGLALCLTAVAVTCLLTSRNHRHAGTVLLAGGSAALAAGVLAGTALLGLPSLNETLQDTFTRHFHHLNGHTHIWYQLANLEVACWSFWLKLQAASPTMLVASTLGLWLLFRRRSPLGWVALAAAMLGFLTITAHPILIEASRLGVLMWMPAVLGLPLLLDRAQPNWRAAQPVSSETDKHSSLGTPSAGPERAFTVG